MYTISKEFTFCASHQLIGLPDGHPCLNLHGHNYTIIVELRSEELDGPGFVLDYRRLDPVKKWIDNTFDHKHLNDVMKEVPTAENIAKFIYDQITELIYSIPAETKISAVTVKETEKTMARYEPSPKYPSYSISGTDIQYLLNKQKGGI